MSFYLKLFRLTNIDVGIGALINCYVFACLFGVTLKWEIYAILFAAVWVIYTLDRIVDTYLVQEVMLSRHYFHRKYRRSLLLIVVLFTFFSIYVVTQVSDSLIQNGMVLSVFVLVYLLIAWKRYPIPKEILIAILYSCGVFLAPVTMYGGLSTEMILLIVQHMLLALANLVIISWFERETDRMNGHRNITQSLKKPGLLLFMIFLLHCAIMIYLGNEYGWPIQLSFSAMWILFAIIYLKSEYFRKSDRYGVTADGAFFIPGIILLLP